MLSIYIAILRPKQWVKNAFVVAPLLFSGRFGSHQHVVSSLLAALCFCLVSSAVYIVNDMRDARADRKHPRKRYRPIASGKITMPQAVLLFVVLCCGSIALVEAGPLLAREAVVRTLLVYLVLNLVYTFAGKNLVIGDAFFIAIGFVLRVMAGSYAVATAPSGWILVTTFFLSLFLGFGKRRNELLAMQSESHSHRKVLRHYDESSLDQFIVSAGTLAIISYALYTLDAQVVARFGTDKLIYTVPFVAYGIFRYTLLLRNNTDGDPTEVVMGDWGLVFAVVGWLGCSIAAICLPHHLR